MLKFTDVHKYFGPVHVLKGISLELNQGEVLGLVGENGAGKSTLMNILGGVFTATSGDIEFLQQTYHPQHPRDSSRAGIAFIHQELNLFPNLTIGENIFINNLPKKGGVLGSFISRKKITTHTKKLLDRVGLDVSPSILVGQLTPAQQQLVEIAKALASSPRLIIFDEPTTTLSRHEVNRLFSIIADLKSQNIGIIYISHNLEDVLSLSDHIAILRDGELISKGTVSRYTKTSLVHHMIGRSLDQYYPDRDSNIKQENYLTVSNLTTYVCKDVSFEVHKSEILGIYGLIGAGRTEMARAIYGLDAKISGSIQWKGQTISPLNPQQWIQRGVVFLTEDRREEGLLLSKSVNQNVRLAALPSYTFSWLKNINYKHLNQRVAKQISDTQIRCHDPDQQLVDTLSGGNQQKVVLAKWLLTNPTLIILDEPTKGIDIGAKKEIYEFIQSMVGQGASIIFISSEIEEVMGMSDRMLVMSKGKVTGTFDKDQFNREEILQAALPNDYTQ